MYRSMKRFLAWALIACLPLVIAACGGGGEGSGAGAGTSTISGIAMKGPINGAWIGVYKLNSDGSTGDLLGSGISGSDGNYDIKVPAAGASGPLMVIVKGQSGAKYLSESRNENIDFTSAESFRAVVDAANVSQGVTVGPLTEAAYQKLQQAITQDPALAVDSRVINAVNTQVAALFNVSNILAAPATDPAYLAALKIVDQMVVDSTTSSTLAAMNVINQGLSTPVTTSQSYQAFQQAVAAAATTVISAEPAIAQTVQAMQTQIASPPAQPVLSNTTAHSSPAGFTATASSVTATTSLVTLVWSPSTTAGQNAVAGYDVYRDGKVIATVTTEGYIDSSVVPNVTYTYDLIAFDAAGNHSVASSQLSVKPLPANLGITVNGQLSTGILNLPQSDILLPTVPANLSATTSAISATNSTVTLKWAAATDNVAVAGYDILRNNLVVGTAATAVFVDPSVTSNVTYSYSIKAFDAAGNRSAASTPLSVTPNQASLGVTVNGQVNPGL